MTELDESLKLVRQRVIDSLPDWKNAAQYPKKRDKPADVWAWQFLRRNKSYWKDWASFDLMANYGILTSEREAKNRQIARLLGQKWGLREEIKDPSIVEWEESTKFSVSPAVRLASFLDPVTGRRFNSDPSSLADNELCIVFNTQSQRAKQFADANVILREVSTVLAKFTTKAGAKVKAPSSNYTNLLRVLDAHLTKERPTAAALVILSKPNETGLYSNSQLCRKYLELLDAALKIVEHRYLVIAAHG